MNQDIAKQPPLFKKAYTNIVKALCVFLMFALHLIKREWLIYPESIIDFKVHGEYLSFILSRTGDICIGVFAFITGYGWAKKHYRINYKRIANIYISYWVTLLLFNWPAKLILTYLDKRVLFSEGTEFSLYKILVGIIGITSQASTFCWYIFFFCLVSMTYPLLERFILLTGIFNKKGLIGGVLKVVIICAVSIATRLINNKMYGLGCYGSLIHGVMYHYFTWVPCVLLGICARHHSWLEKIDVALHHNTIVGVVIPIAVILIKVILAELLHFSSNIDSLFIIPFCYGLIVISSVISKYRMLFNILNNIGQLSLYMWLAHAVLLLDIPELFFCMLRFPVLIVGSAVVI